MSLISAWLYALYCGSAPRTIGLIFLIKPDWLARIAEWSRSASPTSGKFNQYFGIGISDSYPTFVNIFSYLPGILLVVFGLAIVYFASPMAAPLGIEAAGVKGQC